jgi:hypothetical protein
MILRHTFAWLILVVAAIINGAIRETVYKNNLDDLRAHQVSTFTGIVLFGVIIWGMSRSTKNNAPKSESGHYDALEANPFKPTSEKSGVPSQSSGIESIP